MRWAIAWDPEAAGGMPHALRQGGGLVRAGGVHGWAGRALARGPRDRGADSHLWDSHGSQRLRARGGMPHALRALVRGARGVQRHPTDPVPQACTLLTSTSANACSAWEVESVSAHACATSGWMQTRDRDGGAVFGGARWLWAPHRAGPTPHFREMIFGIHVTNPENRGGRWHTRRCHA
jgi:hypothetical protein